MLRWLSSLTDSRPLGSTGGARKFASSLDRDIFAAADAVCTQLRSYVSDAEHGESATAAPLLELDARTLAITARLERDYLAASLQSHSLRDRLWDAGYDWAMRYADAHRAALGRATNSVAGRASRGAFFLVSVDGVSLSFVSSRRVDPGHLGRNASRVSQSV